MIQERPKFASVMNGGGGEVGAVHQQQQQQGADGDGSGNVVHFCFNQGRSMIKQRWHQACLKTVDKSHKGPCLIISPGHLPLFCKISVLSIGTLSLKRLENFLTKKKLSRGRAREWERESYPKEGPLQCNVPWPTFLFRQRIPWDTFELLLGQEAGML